MSNLSEKKIICLLTSKETSLYQWLEENDKDFKIAIQGLLDLYNKEKEKNNKYKDTISNLNKNWISKENIKYLLEKLKDKEQELTDEQGYWGSSELQVKIELLEELLEEE